MVSTAMGSAVALHKDGIPQLLQHEKTRWSWHELPTYLQLSDSIIPLAIYEDLYKAL